MSACELCHPAGAIVVNHRDWRVVMVDDPDYPGFCRVIWNHHVREMTDLDAAQRERLMAVVWQVESVLREVMQPEKINLASLGNVVPHLHWHVIPRYRDDRHFPNPIWGSVARDVSASSSGPAARQALLPQLRERLAGALADQAGKAVP